MVKRRRNLNRIVARKVKKDVAKVLKNKKTKRTKIGSLLRTAGAAAGGYFGFPQLGKKLGAGISQIFGQGNYTVATGTTSVVPDFGDPLTQGVNIRHKEYIRDIKSSVDFASLVFALNPGDPNTFPWGHVIANQFEEYRFNGLVFTLKTNSATAVASTNTALGVWGAVTQYDPTNPDFTSKQEAENYVGVASGVPCINVMHAVECKKGANVLNNMYTRGRTLPETEDPKFYDWGKTQIFTAGSQAESVIGELWVSYDITYFKPKLPSQLENQLYDQWNVSSGSSGAAPFSGTRVHHARSTIASTLTNSTYTMDASTPAGDYVLYLNFPLTASAAMANPTVIFEGEYADVSIIAQSPQTGAAAITAQTIGVSFRKKSIKGPVSILFGFSFASNNGSTIRVYAMPPERTISSLPQFSSEEVSLLRKLLKMNPVMEEEEEFDSDSSVIIPPKLYRQKALFRH